MAGADLLLPSFLQAYTSGWGAQRQEIREGMGRGQVALELQLRGVQVVEASFNYTAPVVDLIMPIMMVEAASNFDRWQRAHYDDLARRQDFWPPLLRLARVIPAVEYLQVNLVSSLLSRQ